VKTQNQSIVKTTKSNTKDFRAGTPSPAATPTPRPHDSVAPKAVKGRVRVGASKEMVVIVLDLASPQAFAYNPATGAIEPESGDIQAAVNPIPGIGITVKKKPGGKSIAIPMSNGTGDLPADAEAGNYDLTVSVPQKGAPPAVITCHDQRARRLDAQQRRGQSECGGVQEHYSRRGHDVDACRAEPSLPTGQFRKRLVVSELLALERRLAWPPVIPRLA
jgi:hypothetical protein